MITLLAVIMRAERYGSRKSILMLIEEVGTDSTLIEVATETKYVNTESSVWSYSEGLNGYESVSPKRCNIMKLGTLNTCANGLKP